MAEILVGRLADVRDGAVVIVSAPDVEIGVFRKGGDFYAYENVCLHQGGPVCEGLMIPKVEDVVAPDRTLRGQRFVVDEMHFVCPWHGYEYKLETGECIGEPGKRLRKFNVVQREGSVYVEI